MINFIKQLKKYLLILIAFLLLSGGTFVNIVYAQPLLNPGDDCIANGNCQLDNLVGVVIKASSIILAISGSLALLALIAGGMMFLLSAGNKTWVDRGKATITGAIIGLIFVFISYAIITFVLKSLGVPGAEHWAQINKIWNK